MDKTNLCLHIYYTSEGLLSCFADVLKRTNATGSILNLGKYLMLLTPLEKKMPQASTISTHNYLLLGNLGIFCILQLQVCK